MHPSSYIAPILIALAISTFVQGSELEAPVALKEAKRILAASGASEIESAYHFPSLRALPEQVRQRIMEETDDPHEAMKKATEWFTQNPGGSYSEFYSLSDGTCLELRIEISKDERRVSWMRLGIPGQPYPGKVEWLKLSEKGKLTTPKRLKLER
jgi:hypothetical protein